MGTASPPAQRFSADDLRAFTAAIFRTAGVADKDAQVVAHGLVDSNLRGVDTHGITRIPIYLERLNAGLVNAQARPRIVTESPTTVAVDGDNGLGHVVCDFAIDATIERAKANGACWTGIRESNHNGSQGYWALRGARAGLMTWAFTNGEAIVAPWGGSEKFVSTNPICIAMPTDPPDELVLDMATTQVAAGHIFLAQSRGEPIPEGWALDADGNDTTDPAAFLDGGSLLPLGGYKGAGLSLLIDVMAGILSGAASTVDVGSMYWQHKDRPQRVGHCFLAVDVSRMMPLEEFKSRVADTLAAMRAVARRPGFDQVFAPGDIEAANAADREANGCPLTDDIIATLTETGAAVGVEFPSPVNGSA
ncbi:MAG: Ldh family oxidoreductase [Chloroflexi bacterium]|nr:Ldh family oxidoreductase [Chloroflexota bacterium]